MAPQESKRLAAGNLRAAMAKQTHHAVYIDS